MITISFFILVSAVAPSLAILSYFYLRDRYEAEPLQRVAIVFFFGMLSTLPVVLLKWGTMNWSLNRYLHTFFISTLLEEIAKLSVTYLVAVRHRDFNEEYDGILYAVSASLGFATVENVLKVFQFGVQAAAIRGLLSVPGHALFGVLMGSYLGRAKFQTHLKKRKLQFTFALLVPWLTHAIYDTILLTGSYSWMVLLVPFSIWLVMNSLHKMDEAEKHSPFKPIEM